VYNVPIQKDKLAVVTGSNSGTGKEATRRLVGAGAHVIMAVRTIAKGEDARLEILGQYPDAQLDVRYLDVADLSSVKAFAETVLAANRPLDLLINNAGVMAPPERLVSVDGFELQFATNFLGPFALTLRLLPLLLAAREGRVATMSSSAAAVGTIRYKDLQRERRYIPYLAYAQSKLADLLFAQQLARVAHQRGWHLMSNAAHPGFTRTNLLTAGASLGRGRKRPPWMTNVMFLASQGVEPGTEPLLYAATSPDALSGAYYGPRRLFGLMGPTTLARVPRSARHDDDAARLWNVAEKLTGVTLANT
jgi:NAD(P)-dependent dehydrogenase (short-subunit alcohol dehydrogenase family)